MYDEEIFTEQAEYINNSDLETWHIEHPNEKMIMKKLCQGGAKLLTGPRGCGKTTLLLNAHNEMRRGGKVFSVYVNFKTSLKIEPLYRGNVNGSYWFNQWLLLKVYEGIYKALEDYDISKDDIMLEIKENDLKSFISKIELGQVENLSILNGLLTVSTLENEIKKALECLNCSLCVLLLDDAAHAFSKEQQYDFFEFFRSIKSRIISPKAAIYPGVTNFSASFHVGHDAEEIDVWIKPLDSRYFGFMTDLLKKRVGLELYGIISKDENLLKLICYASFGIPRSLLNIVRFMFDDSNVSATNAIECNKKNIMSAIKKVNDSTLSIYKSLEDKLPIYKDFVSKGTQIFNSMVESIKEYNKKKEMQKQTVEFGIKNPLPMELEKVFDFFQYAGLVMYDKEISKGDKGRYSIYIINYGILLEQNAFFGRKNVKGSDLAIALSERDSHEYKRSTMASLVGNEDIKKEFPLSLPPCPRCNTPRISPDTRFCSQCGQQLTIPSVFIELVNNGIEKLPLTEKRIDTIKKYSSIRTIKDILVDTEHKELRSVPQIGPYWTKKIISYAEEYIG